jgi:hypothetical protein
MVQAAVSADNPADVNELSRHRYEQALSRVELALRGIVHQDGVNLENEMRIVRMVGCHRVPWYGQVMDPEDSSVSVGVVLRNAFEALGDYIDVPTGKGLQTRAHHWFTQRYLRLWRQGKREYNEWLDTLGVDRSPG